MSFVPRFSYSHDLVRHLGVIEGARAVIEVLPLPPDTTLRLRHDALQRSTRSSTQIEGNPLDEVAVRRAIARSDRTVRDAEQEVRNYWRALDRVEEFAEAQTPITKEMGLKPRLSRRLFLILNIALEDFQWRTSDRSRKITRTPQSFFSIGFGETSLSILSAGNTFERIHYGRN